MSFAVRQVAGTSFSARILAPDMNGFLLRSCVESYDRSGDGFMSSDEFGDLTRSGHIINSAIFDELFCHAIFGVELMRDRDGPYVSFLYFDLWHGRLLAIAPAVIATTYAVAREWHRLDGGGEAPARCLLKGRDGWQRMLPRLGIRIDERGWITEAQEAFGHGIQ